MDIIWEELKRNNINIDKDMLSFYISKCLDEQLEMYDSLNARFSPMCIQPVFFIWKNIKLNRLVLIGGLSYFTTSCMLNVAKVNCL